MSVAVSFEEHDFSVYMTAMNTGPDPYGLRRSLLWLQPQSLDLRINANKTHRHGMSTTAREPELCQAGV